MKRFLARDINDLDDVRMPMRLYPPTCPPTPPTCPPRTFVIQVRMAMRYLGEIREREAMLDWVFAPVEEKYTLLTRHAMVVSAAIVSGGEVHLAHQAPTPCTSLHPSPPLVPSHSTLTPLAHRTPLTLLTDLLLRPPHPPTPRHTHPHPTPPGTRCGCRRRRVTP